jgi:hypothetical protein
LREAAMLSLLDESGTLHAAPKGFPLLSDEQANPSAGAIAVPANLHAALRAAF